jgi:hypothetical protein
MKAIESDVIGKGRQFQEVKILTAVSAIPTNPPGKIPSSTTKRHDRMRAILNGHDDGTPSSDAGEPVHITFTTLR